MSRIYDAEEPNVIDESLLRQAVDEQVAESQSAKQQILNAGPNGDAIPIIRNANTDPIEFVEVVQLRLDYKNILRIDNLWHFKNLKKLQLDNNILTSMEGLETLVNLVCLDMSFNNIREITNLETLINLEDLILSNNRISEIKNLSSLKNLRVLNLSTNLIKNKENVNRLRCLTKLQSLILKDNVFGCSKDEYYDFIVAFLPRLIYLDYRLVSSTKRASAVKVYETKLAQIEDQEKNDAEKEKNRKYEEELRKCYKKAHVLKVSKLRNTENSLFLSMFHEDNEGKWLLERKEICLETTKFRKNIENEEQVLFNFGQSEYTKRENDHKDLLKAITYAADETRDLCICLIDHFIEYKRTTFAQMINLIKSGKNSELITLKDEYLKSVELLWKNLMTLEVDLVDRLEETLEEFERNYIELIGVFKEQLLNSFVRFRELQTDYFEKIKEIATDAVEKIARGVDDVRSKTKDNPFLQATDDLEKANTILDGDEVIVDNDNLIDLDDDEEPQKITEDAKIKVFADKETVASATSASHDMHNGLIDQFEDEIRDSIDAEGKSVIESVKSDEAKRNRARLAEITKFIRIQRLDVDNIGA